MTTKTWLDVSADFGTDADWSPAGVPGPADLAIFNTVTAYVVTIGTADAEGEVQSVANVTLVDPNATLEIAAGSTLAVAGTVSLLAGGLQLGGVLAGGTLLGDGGYMLVNEGTLIGETIAGTISAFDYDYGEGDLSISGGLAFATNGCGPGVLDYEASYSSLSFLDAETLSGGVLVFDGYNSTLSAADGLTIAAGFTLEVSSDGTLAGSFVNEGTIDVAEYSQLSLGDAALVNEGVIRLEQGAELVVGGLTNAAAAALAAGIEDEGGSIAVEGVFDNTGAVLDYTSGTFASELNLSQAVVVGGTIRASGSLAPAVFATLAGVTFQGVFDVDGPYSYFDDRSAAADYGYASTAVDIVDGLTLEGVDGTGPGTIMLASTELDFLDNETLDNAIVTVSGAGIIESSAYLGTLTLGSQLTLDVGSAGLTVSATTLISDATASIGGGGLELDAESIENLGSINVAGGGLLLEVFDNEFSNSGSITLDASSTLTLDTELTTPQLLSDLVDIQDSGTLVLEGNLDNSNEQLDLPESLLLAGEVTGGTIINNGDVIVGTAVLDGVTFEGTLDFGGNSASVEVEGGINLQDLSGTSEGTINLDGDYDDITFEDGETLANAVVNITGAFGGFTSNYAPLAFAASMTVIVTASATFTSTTFSNAGYIGVSGTGTALDLSGPTLINDGLITVSSGAQLAIGTGYSYVAQPLSVSGTGDLTIGAGGFLDLYTSETTAQLLSLAPSSLGIEAVLTNGTLDNTNATLSVSSTGEFAGLSLFNSTLSGGVLATTGGTVTFSAALLVGVTVEGPIVADSGTGFSLAIEGGFTLLAADGVSPGSLVLAGDGQYFDLDDSEVLDNFAASFSGSGDNIVSNGPLLFGTAFSLNVAGSSYISADTFTNLGQIVVADGASLSIEGDEVVSTGIISVGAGAVLEFQNGVADGISANLTLAAGAALVIEGEVSTAKVLSLLDNQAGVALTVDGTLDNSGSVFAAGAGPLTDVTLRGDIVGGTLVLGSGLDFVEGTLTGVTVQGSINLDTFETLSIASGLTLESVPGTLGGTLTLNTEDTLSVLDNERLDHATILAAGEQVGLYATTLAFGPNLLLDVTDAAALNASSIVNFGTIEAAGSGETLIFATDAINNSGTIIVGADDTLGIAVDQFGRSIGGKVSLTGNAVVSTRGNVSGFAASLATGSTLELGGTATTAQLYAVLGTTTGVFIDAVGALNNAGTALISTAGGTLGDMVIEGQVNGGLIANRGGSLTVGGAVYYYYGDGLTNFRGGEGYGYPEAVLNGVTFDGPLDLTANSALEITGGISLNGASGSGPGTIVASGSNNTIFFADIETLTNVILSAPTTDVTFVTEDRILALTLAGATTFEIGAGMYLECGTITNAGILLVTGSSALTIDSGSFTNAGTVALAAGATLDLEQMPFEAGTIFFADGAERLDYDATCELYATLRAFYAGDTIDFTAISFASTLGLSETFASGVLDLYQGATLAAALTLPSTTYTTADFTLQADASGGTELVTDIAEPATPPCFLAGTRIRTADGEIAVEDLVPGMTVPTRFGGERRIRWIGQRRVACSRHPQPERVMPIRVRAGAMAPDLPARDLLLSPDHSLFVDGVLIPVQHLLNGATVLRDAVDTAQYFHVELDRHDVVFAEGVPAESYLDTGNRAAFAGGAAHQELHPDFAPRGWTEACAPLREAGVLVEAARTRLLARARTLGYQPTAPAAPVIEIDGRVIAPARIAGTQHRYLLPSGAGRLTIRSGTGVPASHDPAITDHRHLGVALGGIALDGRTIPLTSAALGRGFYAAERIAGATVRWTDGAAELDLSARPGSVLELRVLGTVPGWTAPDARSAAGWESAHRRASQEDKPMMAG